MIKVSVIIPVYNVEDYLVECLESIIHQSLKELEIICIDDCSTDGSYNILLEYAKKDNRLKILKNPINSGIGYTRNIGINISIGEYIYFMDSDDYIDLDYIENLYNTAKKYDSDITSNLNIIKLQNNEYSYYLYYSEKIIENNDIEGLSNISIKDEKYSTKEYIYVTVWNKIIRRDFLIKNKLYCLEIKARYGDADLYYRMLAYNPKTSYNHKSKYYYRIHDKSIVQSAIGNIEPNVKALEHLYNSINFYKEKGLSDSLKYLYYKCWIDINYLYLQTNYNINYYPYVHKFANDIELDINIVNNLTEYDKYISIKMSSNYSDYLRNNYFLKKLEDLTNKQNELSEKIDYNSGWIKFFGINISKKYILISLFGIKIIIKK